MTNKNIIKNEKYNFDEKFNTTSVAKFFTYLYSDKFIFQDNIMYHYNGVYWKGDPINLFINI